MTRTWSGTAQSALASSSVRILTFCQLDFDSGIARFCTAFQSVSWNGQTWLGTGNLIEIDPIEEKNDTQSVGLAITISGVPSGYLSTAQNENYQGRRCQVWAAPLDTSYGIIEGRLIYRGQMDTMTVQDGSPATIRIATENVLARLNRAPGGYYNDADQKSRYPGDLLLEGVSTLARDSQIKWGQT
jgi:hypothetical protein